MAKKVVLAGACRTAIGRMGGALSNTPAADLGAIVIKEALNRAGVKPEMVDEVLMGCVIQAAQGERCSSGIYQSWLTNRSTSSYPERRLWFWSEMCKRSSYTDSCWTG